MVEKIKPILKSYNNKNIDNFKESYNIAQLIEDREELIIRSKNKANDSN